MNVIQRMLRHGRPSILLDQNTGFVKEIRFVNISEYYYKDASNFRDAIQNILDSINYKELYYDPNDHTLDNIDPASLVSKIGEEEIHYNSAIHFSLPTLSNY